MNTLMGDCTVFGVDEQKIKKNDPNEITKRDNIRTKQLTQLLDDFQDCHSLALNRLYVRVGGYKALGAKLGEQLRTIIDRNKNSTLRRLVLMYNPYAVKTKNSATTNNAKYQPFHLTNAHIKKFGSEIGLDPNTTIGDRHADINCIVFRDPTTKKTITEEQFKQIFKEAMQKEIRPIAAIIASAINGSIKSGTEGNVEDISHETFRSYFIKDRKKAPLTSDKEKAFNIFQHKDDIKINTDFNTEKLNYKISEKFVMYLLEDLGFIKNYTSNYMKKVRKENLEVEVRYSSNSPVKKPYKEVEADLENVTDTLCNMT